VLEGRGAAGFGRDIHSHERTDTHGRSGTYGRAYTLHARLHAIQVLEATAESAANVVISIAKENPECASCLVLCAQRIPSSAPGLPVRNVSTHTDVLRCSHGCLHQHENVCNERTGAPQSKAVSMCRLQLIATLRTSAQPNSVTLRLHCRHCSTAARCRMGPDRAQLGRRFAGQPRFAHRHARASRGGLRVSHAMFRVR